MSNIIKTILNFISIELTVVLTATLPIIELKGAIPVGISLGLSPLHAFILSFFGSMLPVPFILFLIRPVFTYLKKTRLFKYVNSLEIKSLKKSDMIQKYRYLGLFIFVAIPLPGTGVWTGSLIASLLDMRFKWVFPAILIGNLIAGILIMGLSHGVYNIIT